MSEWFDNQKQSIIGIRQLLQERIEKDNTRRELIAEEAKRLIKLEGLADKLKRGKNLQNRQLLMWLREEEYEQLEYEWKKLRSEKRQTKRLKTLRRKTEASYF